MTFATTTLLGTIAGLTIFLGLPIARLKNLSRRWQALLNAIAIGILVFLLWDVITKATEPINTALNTAKTGSAGTFLMLLALFIGGFGIGLLSLVYFERQFIRPAATDAQRSGVTPTQLALMIAAGIGVHNFAEGLAIGQASRANAIGLATILMIGFGLHNATEGFGIAAPLTIAGARPAWGFLALAGLIGGGPTFVGTMLGYSMKSDAIFVLCLALAAGSIFYVVAELLNVGRRFQLRELAMWGVLLGFFAAYGTDLLLTWSGT